VIRPTLLKILALALLLGLPVAGSAPAFAHANLVSAAPAAGASVGAPLPNEIRLSFSEDIELAFSKVTVKLSDGQPLAIGTPTLDPADPKTLIVPLAAPLTAGTVTVEWATVAADGHKSKGSYTFDVAN
jgi:methionine-rich copper-binding protein CopC